MKFIELALIIMTCLMKSSVKSSIWPESLSEKNDNLTKTWINTTSNLFRKYADADVTISPKQLENFLDKLFDSLNSTFEEEHKKHHENKQKHEEEEDNHDHEKTSKKLSCFNTKLKNVMKIQNQEEKIDKTKFSKLSTIIVNDIDECFSNDNYKKKNEKVKQPVDLRKNWLFAFVSAIIITIIGILCYLIVPTLNTYLFQFLVALAVGTLCGDALLHLIPHAFSEHSHGDEMHSHDETHSSHNSGVYKGLGALCGIYVFFLIEKIMQIRRARKEKRHKQNELETSENEEEHKDINHIDENDENEKKELEIVEMAQNGNLIGKNKIYLNDQQPEQNLQQKDQANIYQIETLAEDQSCLVIHANKELKYISQYLPNNKCTENVDHHDHENEKEHLHQHSNQKNRIGQLISSLPNAQVNREDQTELLIKNESNNPCLCAFSQSSQIENQSSLNESKSESHDPLSFKTIIIKQNKSHGHSHSQKKHKYKSSREKAHHDHHQKHEKEINDVKLIAWMVLMGDGLHNFSDGIAIGASFASSLTTGLGTAIAVLCHELPHEIGDFAVLRRAGVSLKRALVFNLVSGILCLLGVLIGLLIGGIATLSNWSFLFIAGTFLYISLVDMIPELSEDKTDDSIRNFLVQSLGILVGIGIMLAIALLEDSIIKLFE